MPDIRCPRCECPVADYVESRRYSGQGSCNDCEITFYYSYLDGVYEVAGGGCTNSYYGEHGEAETISDNVYIVTTGQGETYHIIQIYNNNRSANQLAERNSDMSVTTHRCRDKPENNSPFAVYVVSVGEGAQYRIVEVCALKEGAAKIATSIRGTVSKYDALPSDRTYQNVIFHKWFIRLDNLGDRVVRVDTFKRKLSLCEAEQPAPIVTHRRRYSDSLPWRLEVAAPNNDLAGSIANQLSSFSEEEIKERFEYNVDYDMLLDGKTWVVDPKLLELELETETV